MFVCSFVFSPGVPKLRPAKLQELAVTSRDLWTADRKTHKKVTWPSCFPTKEKKMSKKIKLFSKENLQKVSTTCSVKLNIHLYNLSYIHVHTACTCTPLHKSYVKLQLEKKKFYSEQSFIFIELNVFWGYFYQKWVRKSRMSGILFFFFLVAFHHYKIQQIHVVAKEKIV